MHFSSSINKHRQSRSPVKFQDLSLFPLSVFRQRRAALARRSRKASLDVHLLHPIVLLVELLVHLGHVLHADAVGHHFQRVDFFLLELFQQAVPVHVDGRLAVADEADAALHEGADVEVVGVTDVHASDADAAEVLDGLDALVQDLAGVGLEAYCQLDGVEPALGVLAVAESVSRSSNTA
jgi:hypothetical protein